MNDAARILRAQGAARLAGGPGARVRIQSNFGRIVTFDRNSPDFGHPWLSEVGSQSAGILPGFVNSIPAKIKGVPLAGDDKHSPPSLEWGELMLDEEGCGYICVECFFVSPNEKSGAWSVKEVEMVQVADPNTEDGRPGGRTGNGMAKALKIGGKDAARWPVVRIERRGDGSLDTFQICHFNITHHVALKKNNHDAAGHYFS